MIVVIQLFKLLENKRDDKTSSFFDGIIIMVKFCVIFPWFFKSMTLFFPCFCWNPKTKRKKDQQKQQIPNKKILFKKFVR
jgi:ABC-type multidrug transport system permease subunit